MSMMGMRGLGYLDFNTELTRRKRLQQARGVLVFGGDGDGDAVGDDGDDAGAPDAVGATVAGATVAGYHIHCGVSRGPALARPLLRLENGGGDGECIGDGAVSEDGQIAGTYLHGLFDAPAACAALLKWAGLARPQALDRDALREQSLERLADCVDAHLDCAALVAGRFAPASSAAAA